MITHETSTSQFYKFLKENLKDRLEPGEYVRTFGSTEIGLRVERRRSQDQPNADRLSMTMYHFDVSPASPILAILRDAESQEILGIDEAGIHHSRRRAFWTFVNINVDREVIIEVKLDDE